MTLTSTETLPSVSIPGTPFTCNVGEPNVQLEEVPIVFTGESSDHKLFMNIPTTWGCYYDAYLRSPEKMAAEIAEALLASLRKDCSDLLWDTWRHSRAGNVPYPDIEMIVDPLVGSEALVVRMVPTDGAEWRAVVSRLSKSGGLRIEVTGDVPKNIGTFFDLMIERGRAWVEYLPVRFEGRKEGS